MRNPHDQHPKFLKLPQILQIVSFLGGGDVDLQIAQRLPPFLSNVIQGVRDRSGLMQFPDVEFDTKVLLYVICQGTERAGC